MSSGIYLARNLGKRELQEKNKDGRYKPVLWDPVCEKIITRTMHLVMTHGWSREKASTYFRETGAFYFSLASRENRLAVNIRVEEMGQAYFMEAQ
jgi:hypothetical protein